MRSLITNLTIIRIVRLLTIQWDRHFKIITRSVFAAEKKKSMYRNISIVLGFSSMITEKIFKYFQKSFDDFAKCQIFKLEK